MNSISHNQWGGVIKKNRWTLLALFLFLVCSNIFASYYISHERLIYQWDSLHPWEKFIYLSTHFVTDPISTLKTLFYSIREDDYNDLPAFILMPIGILFGHSRLVFILSIVNVFAFAVVVSSVFLHNKISTIYGHSLKTLPLISIGVMLMSPNFWFPIVNGYVVVGGVALSYVTLLLYLERPFPVQIDRYFWSIALLIPVAILFKRWYAYWGLSFYLTQLIQMAFDMVFSRPFKIKSYFNNLSKIILQILISFIFLYAVAPSFVHRIIGTDYSDIYSYSRHSSNLLQSFLHVLGRFGLFYFLLFILGAFYSILDKRTRRFSIFLLVQWLIIFLTFSKTQDFDNHQLYLLMPAVFIFSTLFINRLILEAKQYKVLVAGCFAMMLILNFIPAFSSKEFPYQKKFSMLFTDYQDPPYSRSDLGEFDKIFNTLKDLLRDPDDKVYVLSSSWLLNSDVMNSAYVSLDRYEDICKKILKTHDIDKRDGFPQELLSAKYVIIADPIQYDGRPTDQLIVGIPAQLIMSHQGIGSSFEKLPYAFNMDGGIKVYIYKKTNPLSRPDLDSLSNMLKKYYPDRKNIYEIRTI